LIAGNLVHDLEDPEVEDGPRANLLFDHLMTDG
jgi:hypothetical protein